MSQITTAQFEKALVFATRLHGAQRRKVNGIPYVSHLLSVAALVLEDGGSEAEAIAALLHDAVEDQGGMQTRVLIGEQFGERVGTIVDGCTEPPRWSDEPWQQHKLRYLNQVEQGSPAVHRVVLADKLHNGRSLLVNLHQQGESTWSHFQGSPAEILWFYQAVVGLFGRLKPGWMLDELAHCVQVLECWVSGEKRGEGM